VAKIGDIYKVRIKFDDKNIFKIRPVIIINIKNDYYIIVEITTKKHTGYYDQFKIPINYWKEANLNKLSYFKTDKVHKVAYDKLYQYIGAANVEDIINCQIEVVKTISILKNKV
jgi:uncharacterized protein YifN (PemK superfamily)